MLVKDLTYAPDWLIRAKVSGEDVELVDGVVVWKGGTWEGGTWEDGVWEYGTWKGGLWKGGTWKDGLWKGGTWEDGTWEDGLWERGTWEDGLWERGTWEDGVWEGGTWKGGTWKGGTWKGGKHSLRRKWNVLIDGSSITVGCKTKSASEWKDWLAGNEEYYTPRNSETFRMIRASILAACAYVESMNQPVPQGLEETR